MSPLDRRRQVPRILRKVFGPSFSPLVSDVGHAMARRADLTSWRR
jgi:hypothetical protein